jgi:hypothetical protein
MFIATRAALSAKLRRSGMYSLSLGPLPEVCGRQNPIHAAPTELGRTSGVVVTINMPLLAELRRRGISRPLAVPREWVSPGIRITFMPRRLHSSGH